MERLKEIYKAQTDTDIKAPVAGLSGSADRYCDKFAAARVTYMVTLYATLRRVYTLVSIAATVNVPTADDLTALETGRADRALMTRFVSTPDAFKNAVEAWNAGVELLKVAIGEQTEVVGKLSRAYTDAVQRVEDTARTLTVQGADGAEIDAEAEIKRLVDQPYIPSPQWALSPEMSGYVQLSDAFMAALVNTYGELQQIVPELRGVDVEVLQTHPMLRPHFAKVVAMELAKNSTISPNFPMLSNTFTQTRSSRIDAWRFLAAAARQVFAPAFQLSTRRPAALTHVVGDWS